MYNKELEKLVNPTSVLLLGQKGIPLLSDAMTYASNILGVEENSLKNHPDFLFLSSANSLMGVEEAAKAVTFCFMKPSRSTFTVVLIDRIDQMTVQGQNKLLKQLEDCGHVRFILTAEKNTVLETIKSRVSIFQYRPLSLEDFLKEVKNNKLDYQITGGCPGIMNENWYPEIRELFEKIGIVIQQDNYKELFALLHLLKEKDSENFFFLYPELIKNLLDFIGTIIVSSCDLSEKNLNRIKTLTKHMTACTEPFYTKEWFFLCIAELQGGTFYEFI